MKPYLLLALFFATAAHAQEYRFKNQTFANGSLTSNGKTFAINVISRQGNLCELSGSLKNNTYQDGGSCVVNFKFQRDKVSVSVPESADEACRQYCGHNAHFADEYHRLPTACTESAAKRSEQRFQAAYRAKKYAQAVQIKRQYLKTCGDFMFITEQMRTRNDLAVAHKNNGNQAACRATLQPLRAYWNDTADNHSYVYRDAFMKELAAAKVNWQACR